ncbi:hypothetical protein DFA_04371 [Cavenderia fasciculata]|uniref:Uncharacterized protein n=1 Tax=Cavenderia fasciculata TaxID=261658 RepID=F4PPE0_CACFS|nr:uncharacterized protein DFA_04371 [Cavenderia fasciculata]EGG22253.1 hypothetical protein DFA_04371 [Cavenderia fasciculata]|eukprot:XP_004360104.1 hypothetical protein DFA_04371 [Cavenderia fasciculata]
MLAVVPNLEDNPQGEEEEKDNTNGFDSHFKQQSNVIDHSYSSNLEKARINGDLLKKRNSSSSSPSLVDQFTFDKLQIVRELLPLKIERFEEISCLTELPKYGWVVPTRSTLPIPTFSINVEDENIRQWFGMHYPLMESSIKIEYRSNKFFHQMVVGPLILTSFADVFVVPQQSVLSPLAVIDIVCCLDLKLESIKQYYPQSFINCLMSNFNSKSPVLGVLTNGTDEWMICWCSKSKPHRLGYCDLTSERNVKKAIQYVVGAYILSTRQQQSAFSYNIPQI